MRVCDCVRVCPWLIPSVEDPSNDVSTPSPHPIHRAPSPSLASIVRPSASIVTAGGWSEVGPGRSRAVGVPGQRQWPCLGQVYWTVRTLTITACPHGLKVAIGLYLADRSASSGRETRCLGVAGVPALRGCLPVRSQQCSHVAAPNERRECPQAYFFPFRRTSSQGTLTSETNWEESIVQPRVP